MKSIRFYTKLKKEFYPNSKVKVFRKSSATKEPKSITNLQSLDAVLETKINRENVQHNLKTTNCSSAEFSDNAIKVQMISRNLHKQIFGTSAHKKEVKESMTAKHYIKELQQHGIDIESTERIEDVKLKLPPLRGQNIEEHFYAIAKEQIEPYAKLIEELVQSIALPKRPNVWEFREGWTAYDNITGEPISIEYPEENSLVLDVEVCVKEGAAPILATAVGSKRWYSWVSPRLINSSWNSDTENTKVRYSLTDLIPLGMQAPKIVVGHNVSYDRARLREQYLLHDTNVRFVDTMSLHVCISGITSYQRALLKSKKQPTVEDSEWLLHSSLNSLVEVHRLYCGGVPLSKEPRNIFVEGTLDDVRSQFQELVSYCASDVEATHRILRVLYPLFLDRFPHPVTLSGMLEIGSAYLPVNSNWVRYINESNLAYEDLNIEAKYHLSRRADEACSLLNEEKYRAHLWLWDEDWSVQELKMKKNKSIKPKAIDNKESNNINLTGLSEEEHRLRMKFQHLYDMKNSLPVRRPLLPGYPQWYRKLCLKPNNANNVWTPGVAEVSTGMQIASKLLELCWEGYPLHYIREFGWGFLVPFGASSSQQSTENEMQAVPIESLIEFCPISEIGRNHASDLEIDFALSHLQEDIVNKSTKREFFTKITKDHTNGLYKGSGIWCNHIVEGCCYFFKLPHKNGKSLRVGNPLSRDFLNKFSENVLSSGNKGENSAARIIQIARMMSYWRNNRDRIMGQLVIWLPEQSLANNTSDALEYGAICPQIVASGTLTRRATEPTWLTASNSQRERIGSELRAMVQAPPSYKIVGADVDSQELWIASVLGDAHAVGIHGATPLGWMTLSGAKSKGTDMHSVTAKAVGISRDHAKVINYARIYGAGQNFAENLLKQFNPTFSTAEARSKAIKMFAITKGKRIYQIREEFLDEYEDRKYLGYEAKKMCVSSNRAMSEMFHRPYWEGGTESAMFNRLEEIARQENPVTPFLGCRLSRSLESHGGDENKFLPTRINWVVQSGAVDFLHLMLVSMRWLMGPHMRFCLSFHDEIRYLVKDEMAYKAALATHVTNLLARSFCVSRIGFSNLPMSVAFFSSVEVDTVLRKESTMDCKTPSNPHGLEIGYGIPPGESLNILESITKADCNDLSQWSWVK